MTRKEIYIAILGALLGGACAILAFVAFIGIAMVDER